MLADSADAIASMLHTGYLMVQDPSEARAGVVASSVYCSTCSCCFDYSQALFHGGDIYSGTCMQWQQTQYKEITDRIATQSTLIYTCMRELRGNSSSVTPSHTLGSRTLESGSMGSLLSVALYSMFPWLLVSYADPFYAHAATQLTYTRNEHLANSERVQLILLCPADEFRNPRGTMDPPVPLVAGALVVASSQTHGCWKHHWLPQCLTWPLTSTPSSGSLLGTPLLRPQTQPWNWWTQGRLLDWMGKTIRWTHCYLFCSPNASLPLFQLTWYSSLTRAHA